MPVERITISNFKAFGSAVQTVPLKPLTLVFGPNSTGKSSILHALSWLQHGFSEGELDVQVTRRTGIDLGGFAQMVHGHKPGTRPVIGWSIPSRGIWDDAGWESLKAFDLDLSFQDLDGEVRLSGISVGSDAGTFMRATLRENLKWRVDLINWEHPALKEILATVGQSEREAHDALDDVVPDGLHDIEVEGFVPSRLVARHKHLAAAVEPGQLAASAIRDAFCRLFDAFRREFTPLLREMNHIPPLRELPSRSFDPSRSTDARWRKLASDENVLARVNQWLSLDHAQTAGKSLKNRYRLDLVRFIRRDTVERGLGDLIHDAFTRLMATADFGEEVQSQLEQLNERWAKADRASYLLRCPEYLKILTKREMEIFEDQEEDFWLEMNENEQWAYAEQSALDIAYSENPYPYLENDRPEPHFIEFMKEDPEFLAFLSTRWDQEENESILRQALNAKDTEQRTELLLRDLRTGTTLALQDVGVGISQILPILISTYALKDTLVAIEQPELHIHPALQAELGDVFIESALGENKNTFLIETHSEHLILRILRRIRETTRKRRPTGSIPIHPDDVAVLYVEPGEEGSVVRELRINDQGRFVDDWPNGFFEDRLEELI